MRYFFSSTDGLLFAANELRALCELLLGLIRDLNNTTPASVRIYNLLLQPERDRDPVMLVEAGRLLREQVTRPPHSAVDDTLHRPFNPLLQSRDVALGMTKISPAVDGPFAKSISKTASSNQGRHGPHISAKNPLVPAEDIPTSISSIRTSVPRKLTVAPNQWPRFLVPNLQED